MGHSALSAAVSAGSAVTGLTMPNVTDRSRCSNVPALTEDTPVDVCEERWRDSPDGTAYGIAGGIVQDRTTGRGRAL
jgi:hypothetical protein